MSKNLLTRLFSRRENTVSKDTTQLERLAEYYANGEMSKKEFKEAKAKLSLENIRELFDKCYFTALSENTKKAQSQMRTEGRTTGYAPLGYINVINANGEHDVVLDRKTASKIKQLFEMYANTYCTLEKLVLVAKKSGLRSKIKKQPLTKVAIKNILSNPFYYGYARHKGKLFKHKYKPLITKEIFSKCEDNLFEETFLYNK